MSSFNRLMKKVNKKNKINTKAQVSVSLQPKKKKRKPRKKADLLYGRKVYYNKKLASDYRYSMVEGAKLYSKILNNKKITYEYMIRGRIVQYSVTFREQNFMHLCGVLDYYGKSAIDFYYDCLNNKVDPELIGMVPFKFLHGKICNLKNLGDILNAKKMGIVDGAVCCKAGVDEFDAVIRTKRELFAICLRECNQGDSVPVSLVSVVYGTDDMKSLVKEYKACRKVIVENVPPQKPKVTPAKNRQKYRGRRKQGNNTNQKEQKPEKKNRKRTKPEHKQQE